MYDIPWFLFFHFSGVEDFYRFLLDVPVTCGKTAHFTHDPVQLAIGCPYLSNVLWTITSKISYCRVRVRNGSGYCVM